LYELFILLLADRFEGDTGNLIKITNPILVIGRRKNSKQIQPKLPKKKTSINLIFIVDVRPFRQLPELHQTCLPILKVKLAAEQAALVASVFSRFKKVLLIIVPLKVYKFQTSGSNLNKSKFYSGRN
jgi:hypothetical protein